MSSAKESRSWFSRLLGLGRRQNARPEPVPQRLSYTCNICGSPCETELSKIKREEPDCKVCGSYLRMRSLIEVLSIRLWGKPMLLPQFPVRPDIKGVGMSDWEGYALPLTHKLGYTNTFYHKEPRLDITRIPSELEGTLNFILSSDVFEHVEPPVHRAFANAKRLLKPGGTFIFTVPYTLEPDTLEHFPDLDKYEIVGEQGRYMLINKTKDGREQRFDHLVFHGGEGLVLEMRVFSEASVIRELEAAGFHDIRVHGESNLDHGIFWPNPWGVPFSAIA